MSLEKEKGKFVVVCDICGKSSSEEAYDLENFYDVLEFLADNGWASKKVDNEWTHTCEECI